VRRFWARMRSMWRALRRGHQLDAAMHDEMRFHIEMEAARLVRERGLDPVEARRQALVVFGGVEKYKEEGRAARGLQWVDAMSLDARLGVRMLVKHRGLTLAGGFAMAVAVAIGATCFEFFTEVTNPILPFEDGDRVVALQYATQTSGTAERKVLADFADWRQSLRSVEQLGASRTAQHNLVVGSPPYEAVRVAEISASGFAVARTPPQLGRYLVPDDEGAGAPPVIVIGHKVWQSRFGGDAHVVGRVINLGGTATTIVGVMPAGFMFPLDHQYWIPLRADPRQFRRLQGPMLHVFGRLAPGVTLQEAQAELTVIGRRTAAAHPGMYDHLRPLVLPYTHDRAGLTDPIRVWMVRIAVFLIGALTFVVAVNVAILVYARVVTRLGEIAVRTALGATRGRILAQLFIEALALASVGTVSGLVLAEIALRGMQAVLTPDGLAPFWVDFELSATTAIYAMAQAVVAAMIIGVLPGLRATSSRVNVNLRELDRSTGARLGPVWTALVVAQVAVAVAVLPTAVDMTWQVVQMGLTRPALAAEEFTIGIVAVSDERSDPDRNRVSGRQLDLVSRLQSEPGVSAVTFSSGVPGFSPGRAFQFEAGDGVKYAGVTMGVDTLDAGLDLFDVYGAAVVAGRAFSAADLGAANTVIVNETFVRHFIDGNPLGIRFRYVTPDQRFGTPAETSYQIVGVVRDFPGFPLEPGSDGQPTVYHAAAPGDVHPFVLSVRARGGIPAGFTDRFHAIGAAVDPALQLRQVMPLTEFYARVRSFWQYVAWGIALVTYSVLLLSAAGIYAMMSFTVAQRTREIAIRSALGASAGRLLFGIFKRAAGQVVSGLLVGAALSAALLRSTEAHRGRAVTFVVIVAALMVVVGLLAALGPARRGLRIQPSEALRD
jgi:putative ABC transport system permease protein